MPTRMPCLEAAASFASSAKMAAVFVSLALPLLSLSCASGRIPFEREARANNEAILAYQEGQRLEAEGAYEAAVDSYARALPYSRIRDAALYKVGRLSSLAGNWGRAEEAFVQLLADDPKNTAVRQSLAYVYCQSGREGEGLEAYRALHAENPYDEQLFQGYIKALKLNGLDEEAAGAEAEYGLAFPQRMSK